MYDSQYTGADLEGATYITLTVFSLSLASVPTATSVVFIILLYSCSLASGKHLVQTLLSPSVPNW